MTSSRVFWIAGFEGADHVNRAGVGLDMARTTGHLDRLDEDYARLAALGFGAVRESVGWRLAEPAPGRYDFERVERIARAARRHRLQVIWSLMHYGMPDDLDPLADRIVERFAAFASAAMRALAAAGGTPSTVVPINEIGFLAWAAAEGQLLAGPARAEAGSTLASGYEIKRRLATAALAAIVEIRRADPQATVLAVEPLVHVVAPRGRPDLDALAAQVRDYQWQVFDLLLGRLEPRLGGHEGAIDRIGVNHYHNGQWEVLTEARLHWHLRDERRRPFADLLGEAWQRCRKPLLVAETSHFGDGRAPWLDDMAGEVLRARGAGVPVEGLCLYPIIDRPDWNDAAHWHHSGLFDIDPADPARQRRLEPAYAAAIARWQRALPGPAASPERPLARPRALAGSAR